MLIRFPGKRWRTLDEIRAGDERHQRARVWFALAFSLLVPLLGFVPLFVGLVAGDINPAEVEYTKAVAMYGIVAGGLFSILRPRKGEGAGDRHGASQ
ncbi:hypothetical protein [Denitromonas sp.]|uniref:hypothetical protein n=1 Tax=Denitromonas sp. TaxID=2734609 RepID=UPI002AFF0127|nr:hypothetical protein [Denitromonas sp.]